MGALGEGSRLPDFTASGGLLLQRVPPASEALVNHFTPAFFPGGSSGCLCTCLTSKDLGVYLTEL